MLSPPSSRLQHPSHFTRLPQELQILIWKYAFYLGPCAKHGGLMVYDKNHTLDYLKKPTNYITNTCFQQNPAGICGGNHSRPMMLERATGRLDPEPSSAKSICLGGGYSGEQVYDCHVIVNWDTGLPALMQVCYPSRLVVLECWKERMEFAEAEDLELLLAIIDEGLWSLMNRILGMPRRRTRHGVVAAVTEEMLEGMKRDERSGDLTP